MFRHLLLAGGGGRVGMKHDWPRAGHSGKWTTSTWQFIVLVQLHLYGAEIFHSKFLKRRRSWDLERAPGYILHLGSVPQELCDLQPTT